MLSSSSSKRDWDSCSQNSDSSNMDCDCDAESKLWESFLSSSALELDNDDDEADATKGWASLDSLSSNLSFFLWRLSAFVSIGSSPVLCSS